MSYCGRRCAVSVCPVLQVCVDALSVPFKRKTIPAKPVLARVLGGQLLQVIRNLFRLQPEVVRPLYQPGVQANQGDIQPACRIWQTQRTTSSSSKPGASKMRTGVPRFLCGITATCSRNQACQSGWRCLCACRYCSFVDACQWSPPLL